MESITNAVNSAFSYPLESDKALTGNQLSEALNQSSTSSTTQQSDKALAGDQLSEVLHRGSSTSQGVEPVSGKTGTGVGGQAYDAGNDDAGYIDGFGHAESGTAGYGDVSGGQKSSSGTSGVGLFSGAGLTGVNTGNTGSGYTTGSSNSGPLGQQPLIGNTNNAYGTLAGKTHGNSSHGLSGTGTSSHTAYLAGAGLGSDRGLDNSGDKYLFDKNSAPGAGGRNAYYADDFTNANVRHEGSGSRITSEMGSAVDSGKGDRNAGDFGVGIASGGATERSRKPGFERQASGVGSSSHGLNSGKPRESERTVVGGALVGGSTTRDTGREPLSSAQGSGAGRETYDRDNTYLQYDRSQVGQATSGIQSMNINDRQGGAYDVSSAGGYASAPQNTGTAFAGGAFASSGDAGTVKDRVAGAPNPASNDDECEVGHHNSKVHPLGQDAHQDGTHKPTYLNYR